MESVNPTPNIIPASTPTEESIFSGKNVLLIVLVFLLVLSMVGINLLAVSAGVLDNLAKIIGPVTIQLGSMFGYSAGELINTTATVAGDVATTGVDIAEGTLKDIGGLLVNASKGGMSEHDKKSLDTVLGKSSSEKCDPKPANTDNAIQKPISANKPKAGWCFVGEYDGSRSCVGMEEHDKCMSGQVFPSQKMCLNPTLSP
jgi:hypothetical protein